MAVEDSNTKQCSKCGEHKTVAEFGKDSRNRNGLQSRCRKCCSVATEKWVAANREKKNAINEKWRSKNPEKVKESNDKTRLNNPGRASIWYAANKEKSREKAAKWRAINAERHKANYAKWYAANPESRRINSHNRRARERAVGGKLSKGLTARLFISQRGKCACCGKPLGNDYHLDHRMPIALGGSNTDDNMQLLRKLCNLQKHAKHPVDFMQQRGFLL